MEAYLAGLMVKRQEGTKMEMWDFTPKPIPNMGHKHASIT